MTTKRRKNYLAHAAARARGARGRATKQTSASPAKPTPYQRVIAKIDQDRAARNLPGASGTE